MFFSRKYPLSGILFIENKNTNLGNLFLNLHRPSASPPFKHSTSRVLTASTRASDYQLEFFRRWLLSSKIMGPIMLKGEIRRQSLYHYISGF